MASENTSMMNDTLFSLKDVRSQKHGEFEYLYP